MIGWAIFAAIAVVLFGLLVWPARLGRPALTLAAAALFAAAAGYASQGSPGLPGAPTAEGARGMRADTLFATERLQFLNKYGETGQVLATADAFNRIGQDEAAVHLLGSAIAKHPDDVDLRIGYAHALLVLAQGNLTPAVQLAFDRAQQTAPASPAPIYFLGLAEFETGDIAAAEQTWRALDAGLPATSPWKPAIENRLQIFDMMRAERGAP